MQVLAGIKMGFLPSVLYSSALAMSSSTAEQREQTRASVTVASPMENSYKSKFSTTAFAPSEKKIELFSKVRRWDLASWLQGNIASSMHQSFT